MKLIDLHKEWMEKGEMPSAKNGYGLCGLMPDKYKYKSFQLFVPLKSIYWKFPKMYWAHSEKPPRDSRAWKEYTPLRQTIVLLICAMNNEL